MVIEKIETPKKDFETDIPGTKPKIKWKIKAGIDSALIKEGLDLLEKGTRPRKVAIHCGININDIEKL